MLALKRSLLIVVGLILTLFVAACGMDSNSAMTTTGTNNTAAKTANTPMANNNNNMMDATPMATTPNQPMMNATPTAGAMNNNGNMNGNGNMDNNNMNGNGNMDNNNMNGNNGTMMIKTTKVNINGNMVTVLTTSNGMMLYYKRSDPIGQSACTGDCAKEWPPVISNSMTVPSATMLPKKLTVVKTANGNQVFYDNHALYTYTGDKMPGQFNGRAMDMDWYLVGIAL
jgi:predicted lipoprotein with Yx(FWY)xxD motif